jgi:hypothetical protein
MYTPKRRGLDYNNNVGEESFPVVIIFEGPGREACDVVCNKPSAAVHGFRDGESGRDE